MDQCTKQWIAPLFVTHNVIASASALLFVASSFGTPYIATSLFAASFSENDSPAAVFNQLGALNRQLDSAEAANNAIRMELQEAKANLNNDQWMNQERAASIALLIEDVLADSDARANLQGNGAMMGWSDGFHLSSSDGQFSFQLGGLIQSQTMTRWQGVEPDGLADYDQWRWGFGMSRAQLSFSGNAYGQGLEYYIEMGWGSADPYNLNGQGAVMSPRMWEAWLKFKLNSEMEIKIGQFNLPFTREALIRAPYQMAVFPTVIEYRMGLESTAAVEFDWKTKDKKFALSISNGSPAILQAPIWGAIDPVPPWSALERDTLYAVTMRHEWKLLGNWEQFNQFTSPPGSERGIMIGLAGHRQNWESVSSDINVGFPEGTFWGITGDITMQFDGASLFASIIYERINNFRVDPSALTSLSSEFSSFVVQGSTYITNQSEIFTRWESGGPKNEDLGGDKLQILTVGMNHYLDGQDMKITADLGFSFGEVSLLMDNPETGWVADSERRNQMIFRTQLQLMF